MEVRHLAHPLRSSIDLRSDIYTNQKAQTPVSTTGPCVGQMHKHIRGILWREQPAPETVHRGTKVAPEWRLDGYVWKPSLWKSSLSSLIPRLGRCITALRTLCHAKGMLKSGAEKLLRKMWFFVARDFPRVIFEKWNDRAIKRILTTNLFIAQTYRILFRTFVMINLSLSFINDNAEMLERNVILARIRSRIFSSYLGIFWKWNNQIPMTNLFIAQTYERLKKCDLRDN